MVKVKLYQKKIIFTKKMGLKPCPFRGTFGFVYIFLRFLLEHRQQKQRNKKDSTSVFLIVIDAFVNKVC